jgi:branched-chain amino acid transport system substrate-binding protein
LNQVGSSIASVIIPAGPEKAVGALSINYFKDPNDPQYETDAETQRYRAFMQKYYPEGDIKDGSNAYGYIAAQLAVQVLKQCGADVSSQNVMKEATNLKGFAPEMVLPGITLNTSPKDFFPFDQVQIMRFNGRNWEAQGELLKVD